MLVEVIEIVMVCRRVFGLTLMVVVHQFRLVPVAQIEKQAKGSDEQLVAIEPVEVVCFHFHRLRLGVFVAVLVGVPVVLVLACISVSWIRERHRVFQMKEVVSVGRLRH